MSRVAVATQLVIAGITYEVDFTAFYQQATPDDPPDGYVDLHDAEPVDTVDPDDCPSRYAIEDACWEYFMANRHEL